MPSTELYVTGNQKIILLSNTSWSVYQFRLALIRVLIGAGYQVYVLTPPDQYIEYFKNTPGLFYIPLVNFESKKISPFKDLQLISELLSHFKKIQPDLILTYTIKANIFGSLAGGNQFRVISVITGLGYAFLEGGMIKKMAITLLRKALKNNCSVWFLNKDDRAVFLSQNLIKPHQSFLLPGEGVDPDKFYPSPYQEKEKIVFLMIGRLISHKGILEYFEAAKLLRTKGYQNIECRLVGFFDEKSPISISRQILKEYTDKNLIVYYGETDQIVPLIAGADCIVLPSYREGLPLSLLEGASMCKALIATDVAGCHEIVENEKDGFLCRPKDAGDLAAKMEAYIALSSEEKRQMGINGREKVLHSFSINLIHDIYLNKIADLIVHSKDAER